MSEQERLIRINVERLKSELCSFIAFFEEGLDYKKMIYELWNAKDVLGHVTFWHESFARNISDLGNGVEPTPLKGKLSEVNKLSVETTKAESIKNLIQRLKQAQKIIETFIYLEKIDLIPYKRGSRAYSREEHLEIVSNHIHKHLKDLMTKYGKTKK